MLTAFNSRYSQYKLVDQNSGRCRLSVSSMKLRGICLGTIVRLRLSTLENVEFELLCTTWPDSNNLSNDDILIVEDTVRIGSSTGLFLAKDNWTKLSCEIISVLPSRPCSSFYLSANDNVLYSVKQFVGLPIINGCFLLISSDEDSFSKCVIVKTSPNLACVIGNMTILIPYSDSKESISLERSELFCNTEVVSTLLHRVLMPAYKAENCGLHCQGVLLHGPPGVGKTYAVKALKRHCQSWCQLTIEEINIPQLLSETNPLEVLQSIFRRVQESISTSLSNSPPSIDCPPPSTPLPQSPISSSSVSITPQQTFRHVNPGSAKSSIESPSSSSKLSFSSPLSNQQRKPHVGKNENSIKFESTFILIDEIDALGGGQGAQSDLQRAIKSTIARWMDRHSANLVFRASAGKNPRYCCCLVATSNRPADVDPLFLRGGRLELEVAVANAPSERAELLKTFFTSAISSPLSGDMIDSMAQITGGYVAADLFALVREMIPHLSKREDEAVAKDMDMSLKWKEAFSVASKVVPPSCLRGVSIQIPRSGFNDIIGHSEVKRQLRRLMSVFTPAWKTKTRLFKLKYPGGVLLHGPPGNSKTKLTMAAANEFGLPVIALSTADIYSPFVGDAEAEVRRAFSLARQASPCMLFIDELDSIVTNREASDSSNNRVEGRILATFLTEMDGIGGSGDGEGCGVIVFGATNRLNSIDAALTRKGRFHHILEVSPPSDRESQLQLLHHFAMKAGLNGDSDMVKEMEEELDRKQLLLRFEEGDQAVKLSGADIENICREQIMLQMRRIQEKN